MQKGTALALALIAIGPVALRAQQHPPPPANEVGASQLAIRTLSPSTNTVLTVTSPAFTTGGDIPLANTQYKDNAFPGFAWTPGPAGTKSYVIVMQDSDVLMDNAPILHWSMVNIPENTTS